MKIKLVTTGIILCIHLISADFFGRNKVQYDDFDFKVLKTESFNIHFYPAEEKAVQDASMLLERWHNRLKLIFERTLPKNQPVLLYASHDDFQQTNAISELLSQEIGGVTEGFMNRVVIPLTGVHSENDHVLGHELIHAFHYDIMRSSTSGITGAEQVPLWFIEGMSEYLSIGSYAPLTSMWMRDAVLSQNVPTIEMVSKNQIYFPYRYGHAIWAFIAGKYGDNIINPLFEAVLQHGWQEGFRVVLGTSVDSVSIDWRKAIKEKFAAVEMKDHPSKTGKRVIDNQFINLSPTLSPDGKKLGFFSSKDLFSIDLYIADAENGEIISRPINTQTDQHFEALRFVNSSGTWSPDGDKLCLTVFKNGKNAVMIVDIKNGNVTKTIELKEHGDILHLAWSPDGKNILISGTKNAICNLFLYNIEQEELKQLTFDRYSELQPSWAPDGRSILFITDKPSPPDPDSLLFVKHRICIYSFDTDSVNYLSIADWATHTNPHYSPDGKSIYFVADPDGISNIYRYSIDSLQFHKITDIATGISGLTSLAPSLSIATQSGKMAFSVFEKASYKINSLEPYSDGPVYYTPGKFLFLNAVKLPPREHQNPIVDEYLGNPNEGLPQDPQFSIVNYRPRLRLLYVGNLFAGLAANPLGVGFAGGISFLFSDLLGDHMLGLGAQLNGGLRDFGAEAFYLNQKRRPNWGLVLSRIPYLATRTEFEDDSTTTDGDGRNAQKITLIDQRMYENRMSLVLQFPLSINRRLEFSTGYGRISYDYESEELKVLNNSIISRQNIADDEPNSLNLFQTSLSFVGDFSYFAFTGPVSGRRFRLEYQQTTGSLLYGTILADYRQYFLFNPLTIAFRFYHLGRYLKDSEDERLTNLFVGNESWIRGYSYYSFDLAKCSEEDDGENCPEFSRLFGSRIGVFNMEVRLPIFGVEQFGLINFPFLPTDLVAFLDGGVAWSSTSHPQPELNAKSSDRIPVFSAGGATRFNLFGVLVLQIYAAYPFQRSDVGWSWGFFFAPGW